MTSAKARVSIHELNDLLVEAYGSNDWQPRRDPTSELILTILSQHTSDGNAERAFERLSQRYANWEALRDAEVSEIAEIVKCAGLGRIKAPRIKEILRQITARRGTLDISFLAGLRPSEATEWLKTLPGVGPKTAACVLLFSLQRPALPVDTHVHRIARRLGLVDQKASAERTQEELEAMVPLDIVYDFHVNLITHGRRVCKARQPRCKECVLAQVCPSCGVR